VDIIGYPQRIHAETTSMGIVPHMRSDELRALIKGERSLGCLTISLAAAPRYQFLNIYGTRMTLLVDFLNKRLVQQKAARGVPKAVGRAMMNVNHGTKIMASTARNTWNFLRSKFTPYDGTEILIREFYRSIVQDDEVPVRGEEGHEMAEIMDQIWSQIGPQKA
jgi:predicted dehydrogenase